MIRVTMEVLRLGKDDHITASVKLFIVNDGTGGTPERGNYLVFSGDPRRLDKYRRRKAKALCRLTNWPRQRKSLTELVRMCLTLLHTARVGSSFVEHTWTDNDDPLYGLIE